MATTVHVATHLDTYSGPAYVKIHTAYDGPTIHHATLTAAMRKYIRGIWGPSADVIRLTPDTFEGVWVGANAPLPAPLADKVPNDGAYHYARAGHFETILVGK